MANFPQSSRETYLSQIAVKIYANADDSFQAFLRKNAQKTVDNYAYGLVMDSQEYANHDFTEREANIVIETIVRLVKRR